MGAPSAPGVAADAAGGGSGLAGRTMAGGGVGPAHGRGGGGGMMAPSGGGGAAVGTGGMYGVHSDVDADANGGGDGPRSISVVHHAGDDRSAGGGGGGGGSDVQAAVRQRRLQPRLDPDAVIELTSLSLDDGGGGERRGVDLRGRRSASPANADYDRPAGSSRVYERQLRDAARAADDEIAQRMKARDAEVAAREERMRRRAEGGGGGGGGGMPPVMEPQMPS
eukprot:48334-Chlamydomonas_euryale.AAC.1